MIELPWPHAGQPTWAQGYVCGRQLDDGRWLVVQPLTGGRGRVTVCTEFDACIEAY
jgi:hypothetical protein